MNENHIRTLYRIVSRPSWRVEKLHGAEWRVVSYCGSENVALKSLEKHIARAVRWAAMTPEQRISDILRIPPCQQP